MKNNEVFFIAAEKNFENRVKRWLESQGIYPFGFASEKMHTPPCGYYEKRWGGMYTKSGLPDLHIVVNGRSVDVELKASSGKPSELQLRNIDFINNGGGQAYLCYPKDFETLKTIIVSIKGGVI